MSRYAWVVGLLVVAAPAGAQDAAAWAGIWTPRTRGIDLQVRLDLEVKDNGRVGGMVNAEGNSLGERLTPAAPEGRRLVFGIEPCCEDEPPTDDRFELTLASDGRSIRLDGVFGRQRFRRLTLLRRGSVWNAARVDVLDMAHAREGSPRAGARMLAQADEIEAGLRAGGRADALADDNQGMCIWERVDRAAEARAAGERLARIAGDRSFCEVHASELADPAQCERLTILDGDGATTVRAEPRSRSDARGQLSNGTTVAVQERRRSWARVDGTTPGWIHLSNTHCALDR